MGNKKYLLLYPFSILYRLITDFRNALFDSGILRSEQFGIPVICVGNITVGGTGKTPHTEYLARLLSKDFKVAVLSRGYKRKSAGFRIAGSLSSVSEIGDEPLQIFRKLPEITVAVDSNRRNGIKKILKEFPGTDVIILDDGFQHRWVMPGLSILLTEYGRLITRDHLMPYGSLRENDKNRKRAGLIVVTKTPAGITGPEMADITNEVKYLPGQKLFFTTINYGDLIPIFKDQDLKKYHLPENKLENSCAILVTGIAFPDYLKIFLEGYFKKVVHLRFPDHHYFSERDIETIRSEWNDPGQYEKIIITSEKDGVRLREFTNIEDSFRKAFYYIPVEVGFLKDEKKKFDNLIFDYVGKNKRDKRIP